MISEGPGVDGRAGLDGGEWILASFCPFIALHLGTGPLPYLRTHRKPPRLPGAGWVTIFGSATPVTEEKWKGSDGRSLLQVAGRVALPRVPLQSGLASNALDLELSVGIWASIWPLLEDARQGPDYAWACKLPAHGRWASGSAEPCWDEKLAWPAIGQHESDPKQAQAAGRTAGRTAGLSMLQNRSTSRALPAQRAKSSSLHLSEAERLCQECRILTSFPAQDGACGTGAQWLRGANQFLILGGRNPLTAFRFHIHSNATRI